MFKILDFLNHEPTKANNLSQINFLIFENNLKNISNHLDKLKNRVLDNNSKVLITGDLNAGKSTIINALLQQNILPTDQQPCTQSFCELIPTKNKDLTGKIFGYESTIISENSIGIELEEEQLQFELQSENSKYNWFKIFISKSEYDEYEESEVTVSFIDSPGLNTDLFKTTSLFNQQRDIDVIVFVINAAFHLTLSGKDFLDTAAKEKEKIFFIVNKFDEIENPGKCKNVILKQIKEILPETFEDAPDLIHFTSAREYLHQVSMLQSNDEFIAVNDIKVNSDIKQKSKIEPATLQAEFEFMKTSLLNYIYLKRSQSKFSPVKTYTSRLLQDFLELSTFNICHITSELQVLDEKIQEFAPLISKKESESSVLNSALNEVVKKNAENCFVEVKNLAGEYSDEIPKIFSSHPFTSLWKIKSFINNISYRVSSRYLETLNDIEIVTNNYKKKGHGELVSISQKFGIALNQQESTSTREFSLCSSAPIKHPSILELIGTYEVLGSIGSLNLTSIVGVVVGYQPLMSFFIRMTNRMKLNPVIVGTIFFGGISNLALIRKHFNLIIYSYSMYS